MNKILTIAIPTFNRPDCLKTLISNLLDAKLMGLVEINVHDNSDKDIQNLNKLSCADVNYFPNVSNIGYGGNIRSCIKESNGHFLHIISDDDDYNFAAIGGVLQTLSKKSCEALVLTCSIGNVTGMKFNTLLNSLDCQDMKLGDVLDRSDIVTPFNLLPSIIVETDLMKRGERLFYKSNNSYMHSIIFFMGAHRDTRVMFDNSDFVVTYSVPETSSTQFDLASLLTSKEEITGILERKFNVRRGLGLEALEVSKWCFMSGINAPKVQFGFRQVVLLSFKSLRVLNFFSLLLLWAGLLPKSIRCKIYKLRLKLKST